MKNFHWFRQISNHHSSNGSRHLERRLSLGEYRRAVSWSKYLIASGGEIKGEDEDEWSADMSKLFIGSKFASGRHSRIYRGSYKEIDVAIKLISQPEENPELANAVEKQFISEVALLFRLDHPNIIAISNHHSSNGSRHLERRLSLGEYRRAVSWSKYLIASGGEIKGEDEDEWSADMSKLFIGSKFASGRHSRIYRGSYKEIDVAIKLISQPEENPELANAVEKQFISEVALLFRLDHPNIIALIGACKKPPVFCIITEYLSGGSLRKYLHQQEPYSLPLDLFFKLALDIARGMQYLHSQGVLHRDLKSENLLLAADMTVKVADFGISCLESQCGSAKGFTGTYRWMAPEMIKEKHHTKKVDVYSFGIVLWELLTALIPFDNMTPEQAAFAVCQKNARPPMPADCPPALSRLIRRCWSSKPEKRPHFKEIVGLLERYSVAHEGNSEFNSSRKPHLDRRLLRCLPNCVTPRRASASLEKDPSGQ